MCAMPTRTERLFFGVADVLTGGLVAVGVFAGLPARWWPVDVGAGLLAALDAVSARLSTAALTALNGQVELDGRDPRTVAESWLRDQGLIPRDQRRTGTGAP